MGSDASSENSDDEQEVPHPPPEVAEEVFSSMIDSMRTTNEEAMD